MEKRKENIYVSRVNVKQGLDAAVKKAIGLIGGLDRIISPADKILVKANFNSPDRYPASSDIHFIRSVVALLREHGATHITLGASCGLAWQPTSRVLKKKKAHKLAEALGIRLVDFDEDMWVEVNINGQFYKTVPVAKAVLDADKIIYLPNMKTHALARFSMSLKLVVGLTAPESRRFLHRGNIEEKIADLNLAVSPDLIIMDARKCLVTRGPAKGRRKKPGLVFASTDQIAIDVEALKILKAYKAKNRLDMPVWDLPQIVAAKKLNLGVEEEDDYVLLTD